MIRLVLALYLALCGVANAQLAGGLQFPGPGMPAASANTTWDNSNKSVAITLDATHLIATLPVAGGANVNALSIASHTTGKYYWSQVVTGTNNIVTAGVANASFTLSSSALGTTNSVGIGYNTGVVWFNGGVIGTGVATNTTDTLDIAVDLGAKLLWYRVNGGAWKGSGSGTPDPATGTQGASFASIGAGPYFALVGTQTVGTTATATTNFGATAYSNAAPSGFGNW